MRDRVRVFAPASVANLGPGFDTLGMAVEGAGDFVTASRCNTPGVHIQQIKGDHGKLPLNPAENTVTIAAAHILKQMQDDQTGIIFEIEKGLPLASGLGSSAASAVAGALAAYELMGCPAEIDVLAAAMEGEAYISRSYHADNVAPSLYGGIVFAFGVTANEIFRLPVPNNLHLALITPDIEIPTAKARAILPEKVDFRSMVSQTKAIALFMYAIQQGDIALLTRAMSGDIIIEPARADLIPHYTDIHRLALESSAKAIFISGAGPTLCMVADREDHVQQVGLKLQDFYRKNGIEVACRITRPALTGARVIPE